MPSERALYIGLDGIVVIANLIASHGVSAAKGWFSVLVCVFHVTKWEADAAKYEGGQSAKSSRDCARIRKSDAHRSD